MIEALNKHISNFHIKISHITRFLIIIYALSLVPMLIIGIYNWPSADDFSMALQPHETFVETGNLISTLVSAFEKTIYLYFNWIGYFFSSFMTVISPSIYKESFSAFTPFIILAMLTIGAFYFYKAVFVLMLKLNKKYSRVASSVTLIAIVQCMRRTARVEAFYWYSGAINYMFMFGLGLLYTGILINLIFCDDKRKRRFISACILGFLLGGCNYMTALTLAIMSFVFIGIAVLERFGFISISDQSYYKVKKETDAPNALSHIKWVILPSVLNIIGFILSAIAPGNKIRGSQSNGIGAVTAIFLSLKSTLTVCIADLLRWDVILLFLLLMIVFWQMAPSIKLRFKHPILFTVFAYGIISANMTPPLYATGNFDAERLYSIIWAQFVVFSVLTILYLTIWLRQFISERSGKKDDIHDALSGVSSCSVIVLLILLIAGATFFIIATPHYYSASSAIYDLATGSAKSFKAENLERLEILNDETQTDVALKEYSNKPELLFHEDVYPSEDEWINTALAQYYKKESIRLQAK
ncbi:DUF6056 family protein [Butyrivibrio sp. YAB3001]|uniref:DUF6056 family protein n=1 Tax=Butyrivibrio sp. YAB3001 TaxID=1520812 RepID=UPI0008F6359B|nr:DUF6056 family protein [Butyrivibrio sp. YAB3001]SFC60149.1 hypothetical protein SAMN02910398_02651 [Butyrivibrio sp. YAB3001]